ncbi:MAG: tRNA preQ1(34) S-adenosylmethionine ribosyltransferase-isomerase QueA [Oscillospiraceae bacterium]
MKKSDFWFDLPESQIAQTPVYPRDSSRLLKLDKISGQVEDKVFTDIENLLNPGDLLVLNNSRVIPARLYGNKVETGGAIEFLLLNRHKEDVWEIMVKPGRKAKPGSKFVFGDGVLKAEILEIIEGGNRLVKFTHNGDIYDVLDQIGNMPLPPYITEKLDDKERYQTVYSKEVGSAAAPTAGLHFTTELMDRLKAKGINLAYVTLHVGLGTFRPVKEDEITDHKMHSEEYYLPEETANLINGTKKNGKRVIAVGTTSCRTLESVATFKGKIEACSGSTDIFIYPGYEFKVLDGIITNFHLPESTLIMLVSALAGYEHTMNAYKYAVENKYRFFSFGDAMLIV